MHNNDDIIIKLNFEGLFTKENKNPFFFLSRSSETKPSKALALLLRDRGRDLDGVGGGGGGAYTGPFRELRRGSAPSFASEAVGGLPHLSGPSSCPLLGTARPCQAFPRLPLSSVILFLFLFRF